jgi:biotin-(acetyl-CoA carboxylase) ligase
VRVDLISGDNIVGDAFDVDESARLLVRDDAGVVHTMDVGDVVHLRTTA